MKSRLLSWQNGNGLPGREIHSQKNFTCMGAQSPEDLILVCPGSRLLAWLKTGHIRHGGRCENKNTTDGFHQPSNTNLDTYLAFAADSWCWKSLSIGWSYIWGIVACWESEWPDVQMPKGPLCSMPVMTEALDSLFIWTWLQRASHTQQQQQQHSSFIWAALQLIEQDIVRADTEGPLLRVLRLNPEISTEKRG